MTGSVITESDSHRLHEQLGVRFGHETLADVIAGAFRNIHAPVFYITCNLNHLRVLQSDMEFREAYRKATLITLDSRPVQVISRVCFGEDVPLITGADLFDALFRQMRSSRDRPFFICSSDDTGNRLRQNLLGRGFAPDSVAFYSPPFNFEHDADCNEMILAQIRKHNTTHLFLGVGAPKSENWVAQHLSDLPAAHIFCVGMALDFTAGLKKRAPSWLRSSGLEWLHRLSSEPGRLAPRYAGDAVIFARILIGQKLVQVFLPAWKK
ncbi:WecB/TagA/CpsF family glycosyltransferase [Acetobacter oeni]|uniref:WecB/TagA/CpsF family glycosyl transferase n=1 Tax=Acetobacter oeni TaxID=304077 RepID=A0A511XIM9_9PROT|nr:WecB/TagA/CpsF family glycosyltransferase [Acetobacter oeni]MBB3881914.1 N-acetylglucosaminyldiphosphoundecaprenol N-acetyl-beta-D-mannosaminyltransferase [Acetobacter oeni]NHO17763.1 WecB/TagA/CpsF family glycosyltransferase [Acetobacter oeni]GBR02430.1 hypothetical protein AA21952_0741 [Acetobacter oeni LMG 21952]GEN62807.1 WecB/TagA/CpsF family glycosyl transferase [Acetobacter oeni]